MLCHWQQQDCPFSNIGRSHNISKLTLYSAMLCVARVCMKALLWRWTTKLTKQPAASKCVMTTHEHTLREFTSKNLWSRNDRRPVGITVTYVGVRFSSRSEGWPHHSRTFSIYLCPLTFWLTLPRRVMSTSWRCQSRPCVVFLACVHLVLLFALSLSPDNSFVSSWCDHSILASLLWRCLTVPSLLQLCQEPTHFFFCCPWNPQNLSQSFHLKGVKTCFFILSEYPAFTDIRCYRPHWRFH